METPAVESMYLWTDLIKINNNRIEGYLKVLEELDNNESELKSLFIKLINVSISLNNQIRGEFAELAGDGDSFHPDTGRVYKTWLDIRSMFTGSDLKSALEECGFRDLAAQKALKVALDMREIDGPSRSLLLRQLQLVNYSYKKISDLRKFPGII